MNAASFRWRPGGLFTLPILSAVIAPLLLAAVLPLPLGIAFLPLWAVAYLFLLRLFDHRLTIDDRGLTLSRANRPLWTIAWSELQEVRYQPGTPLSKNFDRLVLRTASGTRNLTLDDRLSGRWSEPAAILRLLQERGYTP